MFYIGTIIYQTVIFYSLTSYVNVFERQKYLASDDPGRLKFPDDPFMIEDIAQLWIILELLTYYSNILAIILTLILTTILDIKRLEPITDDYRNQQLPIIIDNDQRETKAVRQPLIYFKDPEEYQEKLDEDEEDNND